MKSKQIKIGLIYGGPSAEHEVSLASAKQIKQYLDKTKYSIFDIKIDNKGNWPKDINTRTLKTKIDIAFIVLHGAYGEDGNIQAVLESENITYTGSKVLASALAMDKWRTNLIAQQVGILTPYSILYSPNIAMSSFGEKIILKPNNGGSSVGVHIINKQNLNRTLKKLSKKDKENLLVQEFIPGREMTVSVLGNKDVKALPVIEIIPKSDFYDFNSKYLVGGSEHIVPAKIPQSTQSTLQASALIIHQVLGCRGMSRSDFIVTKSGAVYFLETNTIPGMTSTSLLPQAAESAGIIFSKLLDKIIQLAE